jgi:hypothetical protein
MEIHNYNLIIKKNYIGNVDINIWNKTITKWNLIMKLYRFEIDDKFSHVKFISSWNCIVFAFMAQMKILHF